MKTGRRECEYVQRCTGGRRKPACFVDRHGRYVDHLAGFVEE
jgi:hypothetical protein